MHCDIQAKTPYLTTQRILLVGEGNFSFAHALVVLFAAQRVRDAADRAAAIAAANALATGSTPVPVSLSLVNAPRAADADVMEAASASDSDGDASDDDHVDTQDDSAGNDLFVTGSAAASDLDVTTADVGLNLTATCFDSRDVLLQKYDDAAAHIDAVQKVGGRVLFGVDATQLLAHGELAGAPRVVKFDRVVFNFPHTGCGIKDRDRNIADQRRLIRQFFLSALSVLAPDGEIHITIKRGTVNLFLNAEPGHTYDHNFLHRNRLSELCDVVIYEMHCTGEPYDSWQVCGIARDCHELHLQHGFNFWPHIYPGTCIILPCTSTYW